MLYLSIVRKVEIIEDKVNNTPYTPYGTMYKKDKGIRKDIVQKGKTVLCFKPNQII